MTEGLDITALVTVRMCHDLARPIGAIDNGIKLVKMAGIKFGQEGDLVKVSLSSPTISLKVFRLAYGQFAGRDMLSGSELAALTKAWNTVAHLEVNPQAQDIAKRDMQVCLLVLQAMQLAMTLGGIARLKMTKSGSEIQATGRRVVIDPELSRPLQPSEKFRNLTANHM